MTIVDKSLFRPTPVLRPRRRKMLAPVVLTFEDGTTCSVVVENVSASGVQASCAQGAPSVGTQVRIALPEIADLWGVVRWIEDTRFGIEVDARGAAREKAAEKPAAPSQPFKLRG